jgi:hypothetical protein
MLAVQAGDHAGYAGADVAAVHAIPVAEPAHQLDPGAGGAAHRPANRHQRGREGVPGQRRCDHVEGRPSGRVDQRSDQLQELGHRAGEAVRDQQRLRVGPLGADVQEVDALAVDLGDELGVPVELRLLAAPVVLRAPVLGEVLEVAQRYAASPRHAGQLTGPAGVRQPVVQVVEVGLGDPDLEGPDLLAHHASPCQRGWYRRALRQESLCSPGKTRNNIGKDRS